MSAKTPSEKSAALNIPDILRGMFFQLKKMAAALEYKSVKELVLNLVEKKLQDLRKKGLERRGSDGSGKRMRPILIPIGG